MIHHRNRAVAQEDHETSERSKACGQDKLIAFTLGQAAKVSDNCQHSYDADFVQNRLTERLFQANGFWHRNECLAYPHSDRLGQIHPSTFTHGRRRQQS